MLLKYDDQNKKFAEYFFVQTTNLVLQKVLILLVA